MRFSAIIPVWRRDDYERVCRPKLQGICDDIVEVASSRSIFEALNRGTMLARHRVKVYMHEDLELLEPERFVEQLQDAFDQDADIGMVGVIGSTTLNRLPWWHEPQVRGRIHAGRNPRLVGSYGVAIDRCHEVAAIDGIFFATNVDIWLPQHEYVGFHIYDMEASAIMREKGKKIVVAPIPTHHHTRIKKLRSTGEFINSAQMFAKKHGISISEQDWAWAEQRQDGGGSRFWFDGNEIKHEDWPEKQKLLEQQEGKEVPV